MSEPRWRRFWRGASCLVLACAPPVLGWYLLRAPLELWVVLGLALVLTALHLTSWIAADSAGRWLRLVASAATATLAIAALAGVLITPFSTFEVWFNTVSVGDAPGGTTSNLLVLLAIPVVAGLAATCLTMGVAWGAALVGVAVAFFAAVVTRSGWSFAVLAAAAVLWAQVAMFRGAGRGRVVSRTVFPVVVLSLAAVVGLFGGAQPRGSLFIDARLHPGLRDLVTRVVPSFPLAYGIPGYGYGLRDEVLGGRPILSPRPILQVTWAQARPLYLRTDVYDQFDGRSWRTTEDWAEQQPVAGVTAGDPAEGEVLVRLLAESYNRLPHTLETSRILTGDEAFPLVQAGHAPGYRLQRPVPQGTAIGLILDRAQRQLGPPADSRYLQVFDDVPSAVLELTRQVVGEESAPVVVLQRLERYLKINHTYSLETQVTGRGEDLLSKFLIDDPRGYCVHFATSFVVMARLAGIPARYVSGFLVHFPQDDELEELELASAPRATVTTISGLSAHTWAEVWLDDYGWTTWEATPAVNPGFSAELDGPDDSEGAGGAIQLSAATVRQLNSIRGQEIVTQPPNSLPVTLLWGALVAAIALGGAMPAYRGVSRLARRWSASPLTRIARALVTAGNRLAAPHPGNAGWHAWRDAVIQASPRRGRHASRAVALLASAIYGGRRLTRRDRSFLQRTARTLRRGLGRR